MTEQTELGKRSAKKSAKKSSKKSAKKSGRKVISRVTSQVKLTGPETKNTPALDTDSTTEQTMVRERPKRRPTRGRDKLSIPPKKGFRSRLVTDSPGRIEELKAKGWSVRTGTDSTGESRAGDATPHSKAVVSRHVGGGNVGIVMDIPEEDYKAFKADEQADLDELERGILRRHESEVGSDKTGKAAAYGNVEITNVVNKR